MAESNCHFLGRGEGGEEAIEPVSLRSAVQIKREVQACLGGEEHRLAALCMADVNGVTAACIYQGCNLGYGPVPHLG